MLARNFAQWLSAILLLNESAISMDDIISIYHMVYIQPTHVCQYRPLISSSFVGICLE